MSSLISIHALREEGDGVLLYNNWDLVKISIHALREEGDLDIFIFDAGIIVFLSTPSARRATQVTRLQAFQAVFLSTPSARRATEYLIIGDMPLSISIHALREEGDTEALVPVPLPALFLSTPSARRATAKTERKHPAFVSLYTSLHKLQRDACKTNRKITPLLAQTAGIPVRSVPENHVCCRFALAGHQKISTLSWANSGCSPTCSTFVW